jgi:hypothetical protein
MHPLLIEGAAKSPAVNFNPETGKLEIRGRSIPENTIEFYKPVFAWLDEYSAKPKSATSVTIQLDYFNTSSAKILADLFKRLQTLHLSGQSAVDITWEYQAEDEDMQEAGEDYKSILKMPFRTQETSK